MKQGRESTIGQELPPSQQVSATEVSNPGFESLSPHLPYSKIGDQSTKARKLGSTYRPGTRYSRHKDNINGRNLQVVERITPQSRRPEKVVGGTPPRATGV
ncbi:unnamed protein product [Cuscuta epithymum]|uniref:Uncharacterized protein n=1 Tax=Cuscuta epithymum TaxID=186058 RepID=A0AAV0DVD7_9ASTE|nr:unnamed protein product [Cuscuta epithymum]